MKKINLVSTFLLFLVAASCWGQTGTKKDRNPTAPKDNANSNDAELTNQIATIAATAKGRVGVDAVILETGRNVFLLPDEHFPMQSVYKLHISMTVLSQVDAKKLRLDQRVRVEKSEMVGPAMHSPLRDANPNGTEITIEELIRFAIQESDGTASDVLMRLAGGAQAIQQYVVGLGVSDINIANTEDEIGRDWKIQYQNWSTPRAATKLLRTLQEQSGLSKDSRALLLKFLIGSTPGAQRLKGLLPAGTVVAHKTGTSGSREGITAATNDIGIITLPNGDHLAIAVFVSDSPADVKTREGVIAKIARAVWDHWSK